MIREMKRHFSSPTMGASRRAVPLMLQLRPNRLGARSPSEIRFLSSVSDPSSPPSVPTVAELAHPTEPVRFAILGSGLSGLSTAFYFLRGLSPSPAITAGLLSDGKVKVVIFEKSDRTGGWCQSLQVTGNDSIAGELPADKGKGKGKLVFETGPRSIRPVALAGWLTVEMVRRLSDSSAIAHKLRCRHMRSSCRIQTSSLSPSSRPPLRIATSSTPTRSRSSRPPSLVPSKPSSSLPSSVRPSQASSLSPSAVARGSTVRSSRVDSPPRALPPQASLQQRGTHCWRTSR